MARGRREAPGRRLTSLDRSKEAQLIIGGEEVSAEPQAPHGFTPTTASRKARTWTLAAAGVEPASAVHRLGPRWRWP
jgi:hypothetical protein